MKEKDKLLFCQVCTTFILTRGNGVRSKNPQDIIKLHKIAGDPKELWRSASLIVKGRVRDYYTTWGLPFDEIESFLDEKDGSMRQKGGSYRRPKPMEKEIASDIKVDKDKKKVTTSYQHNPNCKCPQCREQAIDSTCLSDVCDDSDCIGAQSE